MIERKFALDLLFKNEDQIFSDRVAGILFKRGKVLLQKTVGDDGYSFPGGHVAFGETNAATLEREFKEELGADIQVNSLRWVAEIFFKLEDKPCHQICLFYDVSLMGPLSLGKETDICFEWVSINDLADTKIYPEETKELMLHYTPKISHFISVQEEFPLDLV